MAEIAQITCSFQDEASLYLAYMPFVKRGGLFVRTTECYEMGTEFNLTVKLLDEQAPYSVMGKVVWITPKGAQGNKPAGVGVQFTDEHGERLRNKIETYLAGMLKSSQMTDTI